MPTQQSVSGSEHELRWKVSAQLNLEGHVVKFRVVMLCKLCCDQHLRLLRCEWLDAWNAWKKWLCGNGGRSNVARILAELEPFKRLNCPAPGVATKNLHHTYRFRWEAWVTRESRCKIHRSKAVEAKRDQRGLLVLQVTWRRTKYASQVVDEPLMQVRSPAGLVRDICHAHA
eukprot:6805550-Prymnesium_polylepis.1